MHKLRLRTKIEVIVTIFFFTILFVVAATSITRTISNTHDDIDTFIRNSNGNYWEITGSNIQAAIDDLGITAEYQGYGGTHGYVWLPGNTSITVSSEIDIKDHVTLDMQGCELVYNSNVDAIRLRRGSSIQNGIINVSEVNNYDKSCIHYNCNYASNIINFRNHQPFVYNMKFVSDEFRGTAIYLNTSNDYDYTSSIDSTVYDGIQIDGFEYGIHINHSKDNSDNSYINGNRFTNLVLSNCKYPITVYNYDEEASGNCFINVNIYCNSGTEYIIWNNGYYNFFDNINAYNWDNNSGTRTSYNFSQDGAACLHHAAHGLWISFFGGGDDISIGPYSKYTPSNCWAMLNRETSSFYIGSVTEG